MLVCVVFLVILLGVNAASTLIPQEDYVAYELILNGQYEAAERVLVDSRKEYPDDLNVRYNLALIYSETGRAEMAIQELHAILGSDPHNSDAQAFLATLEDVTDEEVRIEPEVRPVSSETVVLDGPST